MKTIAFNHRFKINDAVHIKHEDKLYPCVIDSIDFIYNQHSNRMVKSVKYHLYIPANYIEMMGRKKVLRCDGFFIPCANKKDKDIIGKRGKYVTEVNFDYDCGEDVVVNDFHRSGLNLYEGRINELRYTVNSYIGEGEDEFLDACYYQVNTFAFWFHTWHIKRTLEEWKDTIVIKNAKV